jgi:glycosyltransferase involved in cell wall biosynthesis
MSNSNKPTVLILIDWFLPAYKAGGPVRSVANLIDKLKVDFNFKIITGDRDLGDTSPFENIKTDTWLQKDGYQIIYLSPQGRINKIKEILKNNPFDKIYVNSLFSKDFTIIPLLFLKKIKQEHKVILAPRGMLGDGALAIKPLKKKVFLKVAKITGIFNHITWHATTDDEISAIKNHFGKTAKIIKIQNLNKDSYQTPLNIIKNQQQLKLIFFSRITFKKNLQFAIDILQSFDKKGITFDIYGSIEDIEYWQKIEEEIKKLQNTQVSYKGLLHPDKVVKTLTQYHYLFLPTKHENYGHVIAEALTAGCGLLISDKTPWRNLEKQGVGFDIPLSDKEKFLIALQKIYLQNQNEYNSIRNNAQNFVKNAENESEKVILYRKLFFS